MLKINKKVEYALMALKFMADKNDPTALVSAREICDVFSTPFDTTAKVMQVMNAHHILNSVKGIKGGYALSKSLADITYMELVRMIEGREEIGRVCTGHKGTCELLGKCNISTPVESLNRKLNIFLENLTLAELLQGTEFNKVQIFEAQTV
ncbi:MAG: Rrf2 family transcriptional regulator [Bdellovibrionales bacterium]|nr:Rrf2 family transcriptional regulator [Bdellovibrionales bacterium]